MINVVACYRIHYRCFYQLKCDSSVKGPGKLLAWHAAFYIFAELVSVYKAWYSGMWRGQQSVYKASTLTLRPEA